MDRIMRQILTISFIIISIHMSVPGILIIIDELNNANNQVEILQGLLSLCSVWSLTFALLIKSLFIKNAFIDLFMTAFLITTIIALGILGFQKEYIFFLLIYVGIYLLIIIGEKAFSNLKQRRKLMNEIETK